MPPPPGTPTSGTSDQAQGDREHPKARNSPKAQYQRPHRTHTGAEFRLASQRKHAEELQEEARRHLIHERMAGRADGKDDVEKERQRIEGLNFDDERKKKGRHPQEDQDENEEERPEETAAKSLGLSDGTGKYFQDLPEDRLGDLKLVNPNEMKRVLGPSVRFAQHAMILAEQRLKEGLPRPDALKFLASLYLNVADRSYANKALREFGPATGIIDLYPLELVQHLLANVPSFLSKVSTARFLAAAPSGYQTEVGKPIVLRYDPLLRIRGFAIKGGDKPGYLFEPVEPPGTYQLTFGTAGRFTVILSALSKDGVLRLEEIGVEVAPSSEEAPADLEQSPAMQRTRASVSDPDAPSAPPAEPAEPPAPNPKRTQDLKIVIPRKI